MNNIMSGSRGWRRTSSALVGERLTGDVEAKFSTHSSVYFGLGSRGKEQGASDNESEGIMFIQDVPN
jgi:hypothetical protein